jgi:multidrug efflux pump subunit AcrA (membrane-fusion protein)
MPVVSCRKQAAKTVEVPPVPVTVQKPTVGTITSWHKTTAELASLLETSLSFATGGRILEMTAGEGDHVAAGQVLGKVDTAAYADQLAAAQSGVDAARNQAHAAELAARAAQSQVATAQAAFEQAERDYNRFKTLHDEGVATESEFEKVRLGYESARNGVQAARDGAAAAAAQAEAARAGVQAAQNSANGVAELVSNGTLRAPFSGRIASRMADPGTLAGPGMPVYRLVADGAASDNRLEVRYRVPESIITHLSIGTPAYLNLLSMKQELPLTIDSLGPEISDSRTAQLISYVTTDSLPLLPGMFGTVRIPIERHTNALLLPENALIDLTTEQLVYVAEGDVAHKRNVTVGLREEGQVEILSGITESDDVIVAGNRYLSDGAKIVRQQAPAGVPESAASTSGGEAVTGSATPADVSSAGNTRKGGAK